MTNTAGFKLSLRSGVVALVCLLGSVGLRYGDFTAISKIPFVEIALFLFFTVFLTDFLSRDLLAQRFEERERRFIGSILFSIVGSGSVLLLTFLYRIDTIPRTVPVIFFILCAPSFYIIETPLIRLKQFISLARGVHLDTIVVSLFAGKLHEQSIPENNHVIRITVGLMGEYKSPPIDLIKNKATKRGISQVLIDPDLCFLFPAEISELERFCFANRIRVHISKETDPRSFINKTGNNNREHKQDFVEGFEGRTVAVTGAAGSIGSEVCRMLASVGVKKIYLVDQNEYGLFRLSQELESFKQLEFKLILGSIVSSDVLDFINENEKIDCLFHGAAYKHVPMLEEQPFRAFEVNTYGTINVYRLAAKKGISRFVLVSSDKAVRPTNTMGASKRLAELAAYELSTDLDNCPTLVIVRFGNVYGSSGSVVETFTEQILNGQPLTITDPNMRRYFMTIPEAVSLIIVVAKMDVDHGLFVLDMGESVRIADLADQLIRQLSNSHSEYPIQITGLRPGEKIEEELFINPDDTSPSENPAIIVGNSEMSSGIGLVEKVEEAVLSRCLAKLFRIAEDHVESFDPPELRT